MDRHGLAAAEGDQVMEWQPISTAPKDGTEIIIGSSLEGSMSGFWMGDLKRNHWGEIGWFAMDDDVLCDRPRNPTNWMPLPEHPK